MQIDTAIATLEKECFTEPWNLKMVQEQLAMPFSIVTVIVHNNELCGYAIGVRSTFDCELYRVAVPTRHRNKGIGKALVMDFVKKCHEAGSTDIFLEVRSKNEVAKRLYKSCNFCETGTRKNYYVDDDAVTFAYNKPKILYLSGFCGCGKTTACGELMEEYGVNGLDLDYLIEDKLNMAIKDVFSNYGECYFRKVESELLYSTSCLPNIGIIALGGGTVMDTKNVQTCKLFGRICYIDTPFEICYERIKDSKARPIVTKLSKKELQKLYKKRESVYKSTMDFPFKEINHDTFGSDIGIANAGKNGYSSNRC